MDCTSKAASSRYRTTLFAGERRNSWKMVPIAAAIVCFSTPVYADDPELERLQVVSRTIMTTCSETWTIKDRNELSEFSRTKDEQLSRDEETIKQSIFALNATLKSDSQKIVDLNNRINQDTADALFEGSKTGLEINLSDVTNQKSVKQLAIATAKEQHVEALLAQSKDAMTKQENDQQHLARWMAMLAINHAIRDGVAACVADQKHYIETEMPKKPEKPVAQTGSESGTLYDQCKRIPWLCKPGETSMVREYEPDPSKRK